jgi:hypothetical protein
MKKMLKNKQLILIIATITILVIKGEIINAQNDNGQNGESNRTAVEDMIEELKDKKKEFTAQNMYIEIYDTVVFKPKSNAIKKTAQKFSMTEEQMENMINDGDLSPLLERQQGLTLEKINSQYFEIYDTYQRELDTENMKTDLEQETKPDEIYADGDTSNSDFDLIQDLTVIEDILFKRTSNTALGGSLPELDIEFVSEDEREAREELFEEDEEQQGPGEIMQEDEMDATERDGIDPLSCLEDETGLENAVDSFEEEREAQQEEGADGEGDTDEDGELQQLDDAEIPSAVPDEWPKNFLCPDGAFFCVDVSFDIGPSESYQKTDNCVACHVQKINEEFDKMLEKPLSPNKISGNIFEVPKCKSAFTSLPVNMKIISMAVPAPKQEKQDMYHNADIDREWQEIKELFGFFEYQKTEEAEQADLNSPNPSLDDRAANKAITNSPPNATINEATQRSSNIVATKQEEKNEDKALKSQNTSAENVNRYFQTIFGELNTMKMYFNNMKDTFEKMKTPCNDLSTKQNCT